MHDITLQINLSPGDVGYASLAVPALVEAHHAGVDEVVGVVDCCRPQKTRAVDPEARFPAAEFAKRVATIRATAEDLKRQGHLDRIVYLEPGDALFAALNRKYYRGVLGPGETHDAGGCALMSYLAALDVARTRYLLHYDADMLLYQEEGYSWADEARRWLEASPSTLAATPRTSPPFSAHKAAPDAPSLHEPLPLERVPGGWHNCWFSTRCFLMDLRKLSALLPLAQGKLLAELLARKAARRTHPMAPEIILFRRAGQARAWRLTLDTERAWLLHPTSKPARYVEMLPQMMASVRRQEVPLAQRGNTEVDLPAWEEFLSAGQAQSRGAS